MEQSQLSQMVNWLDQAHQQDRRVLEQLRQQVERLSGGRDETEQRIAALEAQFGLLSAQLERIALLESYFERFKEQVNAMLERGEAQRQKALQESDRTRQAEITTLVNAVNDFRRELEKYRKYDEEMAARRVDMQRLSGELAKLQMTFENMAKQRDEWTRTAGFVEEQRRQDARRIADLQTQIVEVGRRADGLLPRLQYLEQLSPRLMELRTQLDELRQSQGRDLEKRQFLEAQIDRQIKLWAEEIDTYRQRMDNFERRIEQYAEYHQVVKKATEGLQAFQEQIAREQQESAELVRLSQNRQKTQLEEWQTQQEQRWQQYISEWDRQWADYDRALATLGDQITALSGRVGTLEKRIQLLIQIAEEDAQMRTMAAQEWQNRFEQVMEKEE